MIRKFISIAYLIIELSIAFSDGTSPWKILNLYWESLKRFRASTNRTRAEYKHLFVNCLRSTRVLQTYDVRFLLIIFLFRVGTIIFQKMNTRFNGSFSIEKKKKRERERHSPREMDTISRGKTSRSYTFLPRARARRHQLVANHHRLPFLLSIIGRKLRQFTHFRSREEDERKRKSGTEISKRYW